MRYYQSQRPMRGGFGIGPGAISPFIKVMLLANVTIFIVQNLIPEFTRIFGLIPSQFFGDFPNWLFQPLTYMFLHGGFWHLAFNMFVLWMFGTEIEFAWGTKSFGRFYVLSGLSGALLTLIFNSGQAIPTVGASAAIYGVLVAYWFLFPNRYLYIYFLFPVKVKWAIPGMMILGFLAGGGNIAHMAHLGGALFALFYIKSDWRLGRVTRMFSGLRRRRAESKMEKNRQKAEDIMKRVDAILDKINEVGIEKLTPAERKFLEEASTHLSEQNSSDDR